ncbi:MAG: DEAD/DEAH box helicase, partial [Pirellulaceae bacterium]
EAPAPVVAEAPAPVVAEAPVPVVAEAPVPVVAEAPVPVVAEAPVPVVAEAPVPELPANPVFGDFALSHPVQLAVQHAGYVHPTEVQAEIMPYILDGKDVLAQSQTGTGKTAAFALPLLSMIKGKPNKPKILVLAPTRELATQVAKSFHDYGANVPKLKVVAIYGGAEYESQLRALKRGVHVVVGTPGRVMDHIKRGSLQLDGIESVVLDEADEMLNLGFFEDVEWILGQTPASKQTALFSATMPEPIRRVADQYLDAPEVVTVRQKTLTADTIQQRCVFVDERNKRELLARLLEIEETDGVIVFTKTKDATVAVADHLVTLGLRAAALNGDLPQARRQKTVDQLKSGRLNILVATDVAARGLDVQRISHVFNFDMPHDSESYVHRIGRTGRAGRKGAAFIFLTPKQRGKLGMIERATKQRIEIVDPPSKDEINAARVERFKSEIGRVLSHPDLDLYRKIIADYVSENDCSIEDAAAALAHLSRKGRSLLVEDLPDLRQARRDRDSRGGRELRGGRDSRGENRGRREMPHPGRGMARYWVGVGHSDGVRPGNIVGAVANEVGIAGSDIGSIQINETYSTIDLPAGLPQDVIGVLQQTWVSGKQLRIRPYEERGGAGESGGRSNRRPFKAKEGGRKFTGKRDTSAKSGKPFEKKGKLAAKANGKGKPGKKSKEQALAVSGSKKNRTVGGKSRPKKKSGK